LNVVIKQLLVTYAQLHRRISYNETHTVNCLIFFKKEINKMLHMEGSYLWYWTTTFRKKDKKCLETFDTWCLRRMKGIIWTNHMKNEDILHRVEKERSILYVIKRRKANWIDHMLRRNFLLKQVMKGKIEGTGRQWRRCKKLVKGLREKEKILKFENRKTELHSLEKLLWRRLRTCRRT